MSINELKIIGKNKIEIDLHHKPSTAIVNFKDNLNVNSNVDKLGWAIHQKPPKYKHYKNYSSYVLTIYWEVSEEKIINWHVKY